HIVPDILLTNLYQKRITAMGINFDSVERESLISDWEKVEAHRTGSLSNSGLTLTSTQYTHVSVSPRTPDEKVAPIFGRTSLTAADYRKGYKPIVIESGAINICERI